MKVMKQGGKQTSVAVHNRDDAQFFKWLGQMVAMGMWAVNQPRVMTQIPEWMRDQLNL
jgi:hypothetical protein